VGTKMQNRFLLMFSRKEDQFTSNQDQNDYGPIMSNTFHRYKHSIRVRTNPLHG